MKSITKLTICFAVFGTMAFCSAQAPAQDVSLPGTRQIERGTPARAAVTQTTATTSPGVNSVFGTAADVPVTLQSFEAGAPFCPGGKITPLSVTIKKGKPKSILAITLGVTNAYGYVPQGAAWQYLAFATVVNGFVSEQQYVPVQGFCDYHADANSNGCTITATDWFDLDAAEIAGPGQFKGKPLQVDVVGCIETPSADASKSATIGQISLSVVMEKK